MQVPSCLAGRRKISLLFIPLLFSLLSLFFSSSCFVLIHRENSTDPEENRNPKFLTKKQFYICLRLFVLFFLVKNFAEPYRFIPLIRISPLFFFFCACKYRCALLIYCSYLRKEIHTDYADFCFRFRAVCYFCK